MSASPLVLTATGRFYLPEQDSCSQSARLPIQFDRPVQNLEESLDVLFGVVEVRRDAHALAADADENLLLAEAGCEGFGDPPTEPQPDHVPRPSLCGDRFDAAPPRLRFDEIRQPTDGLGDVLDA